jgi:teichuronic acid exporter
VRLIPWGDKSLIRFLKQRLSSRFLQNVGWLGLGELCIRVFRLVTTVVLARLLNPYDYGLAAAVLTINEFVNVFTKNGVWAKLIKVEAEELEDHCQTAYWLNWIVCGLLFLTQCLVAFPVAWFFYKDNQVILPICALATIYLIIPLAMVHAALIQRENRLQVAALTNVIQVTTDNLLTVILAFLGLGMWAIVLPKVIVAPIWVILYRQYHDWQPPQVFTLKQWRSLVSFGQNILGVELLATLRNNLDYLIIGRFLTIESLGTYYFAFNAGLGISLSAINAIDAALFPHLCSLQSDPTQLRQAYLNSLKTIAWIIGPLVLLQSSLAPIYVPIIFGQKWIAAIPVLILICLSAIPRPFAEAASQGLWILDKPQWDLGWSVIFTLVFAVALLIGVQWQIVGVAAAVLIAHAVMLPLYALGVTRYVISTTTKQARST